MTRLPLSLSVALLALVALFRSSPAQNPFVAPQPEDLMIYHVFIDRFANGDPTNDSDNPRTNAQPTNSRGFHGGDLEGVRQKLPYIAGMGFNGIWLSPLVENVSDYHGYAAFNWYNVEPNFGTLEKLNQLIDEANALGIAVYFDMVAGHQGNIINSNDPGYPAYLPPPEEYTLRWSRTVNGQPLVYPPPFNSLDHFHAHGQIGAFFGEEQEVGELSGLDDLKTETPYVREQMTAVWSWWLENTGVSGFRIDTVKHVDLGFWEYFLPRLSAKAQELGRENYFTFGEIYGAGDNFMALYLGTLDGAPYKLDGAVDFQFYYSSENVFARATAPPWYWADRLEARENALGIHHLQMPNFLDNHDVRRFLDVAKDNPGTGLTEQLRRLELGLVAIFTAPGPPVIYYGTEQAFDGGNDPQNREDMFDGQFEFGPSLGDNFDDESDFYRLIEKLTLLRRQVSALRRGGFDSLVAFRSTPGILAFRRADGESEALAILNTAITPAEHGELQTGWPEGQTVVNALDSTQEITIGAGGRFPVRTLPGQGAEIWVALTDLPPVPPEITAFIPAHGEIGVPLDASIEVRFSTSMDRDSVLAALTITPDIAYTSSWNDDSTILTLIPDAVLAPRSPYTVTIGKDAVTTGGVGLLFQSSATWTTGRDFTGLPPTPPFLGNLARTSRTFTTTGNGSDWFDGPSPAMEPDTALITEDGVFRWADSLGDDFGPGGYIYPTDEVFTRADADLEEVRIAFDALYVHFYVKVAAVSPGASFFTPYIGVAIDTVPESGWRGALGFHQFSNALGISEVLAHPDAAAEFELTLTGPRGATLTNARGEVVLEGLPMAFSQTTGAVEASVPRSALGLDPMLSNHPVRFTIGVGLEEFGGLREIGQSAEQWNPGGGVASPFDPDYFDLAGASAADQLQDLQDFDDQTEAVAARSLISLRFWDTPPPIAADAWMLLY